MPSFSGGYGLLAWGASTDRVRVRGCHFENNGQSDLSLFWGSDWTVTGCTSKDTGYIPINVETATGATIRRVVVDGWEIDTCNMAAASVIQNTGATTCEDVTIANVNAVNVHNLSPSVSIGGVRIRGSMRTTLRSIKLNGCKGLALYVTVDGGHNVVDLTVDDFQAVQLSDVAGQGAKPAVWLAGTAANPITGATLSGVRIEGARSYGLQATYCPDLIVDETCRFTDSADTGMTIGNSERCLIKARVRGSGQGVAGAFYGISVTTSSGFSIDGAHVTNSSSDGIRVGGAADRFTIRGCTAYDDRATRLQRYGVNIVTTVDPPVCVVTDNVLTGNLTGALLHNITDLSYAVIEHNTVHI